VHKAKKNLVGGFLQLATAKGPGRILTQKTPKHEWLFWTPRLRVTWNSELKTVVLTYPF